MKRLFGSSSRSMETTDLGEEEPRVVIDNILYEFHCPKRGTLPNIQILFFHGMVWGDYTKSYINTWKSLDGYLWPKTWLAEEFPNSSILSISYDSSLLKSRNTGRLDLYQIAENLIHVLRDNIVGAETNEKCPTIMVGKDLGCLVIQAVCMKAKENKLSQFLANLKGLFYYSLFQLEIPEVLKDCDGKLVEDLQQQMSRSFGKFLKLKIKKSWTVNVLHAANSAPRGQQVIDISEDYARLGSDKFYSASEDICTITMPRSKTSQSFLYLKKFVSNYCDTGQFIPLGFSFSSDLSYIPLKTTEEAVKQALTSSRGPSVTLLHGSSGSGKSALARNLALHFQAEINERLQYPASNTDVRVLNTDEVTFERVVHMECGSEVDLKTKQKELAEQLHTLVCTNKAGFDIADLLKQTSLLIIMDDVWEPSFLQAMVHLGGKHVKWLILSQSRNLCDGLNSINREGLHTSNGHCTIGIEKVNFEDAQRILATLTGWPKSWEEILEWKVAMKSLNAAMALIISQTDANPLALTCIASNIDREKNTDTEHWEEVADDLSKALKTQPKTGMHGKVYGQSYWRAMELCFNRLTDCQKYLVTLNCLCKGPVVPFDVIKYIFKQTVSSDEIFSHAMKELTGKQLITVKTVNDTAFGKDQSLSLHYGWREFITEEHLRPSQKPFDDHVFIIEALAETNKCISFKKKPQHTPHEGPASKLQYDVLIRTVFLYFDQDFRPKFPDEIPTLQETPSFTIDWRKGDIAPIVTLLVRRCNQQWTTSLRSSALEVLFKYATDGTFEESHTSNLLKSPVSQVFMLRALYRCVTAQQPKGRRQFISSALIVGERISNALLKLLETQNALLIRDLSRNPSVRDSELFPVIARVFAALFPGNVLQMNTTDPRAKRFQIVLDDLISALLVLDKLNAYCAEALANLACGGTNMKDQMLTRTNLLQNLVTAMRKDDFPALQAQAARAVANLAVNRARLTTMVDFQGLLPALVAGLANSKNHALQTNSAGALHNLAFNSDSENKMKMTNVNGLLENLVKAMGRGDAPGLQVQAACVVWGMLSNGRSTILDIPGFLQALVAGLENSENREIQWHGASILVELARGGDDVVRKLVAKFPKIVDVLVDKVTKGDSRDNFTLRQEMFALTVFCIETAEEMQLISTNGYLGRAEGESWLELYKESIEDLSRWEESLNGTLAEHPNAFYALSMKCFAKAKLGDLHGALADADRVIDIGCTQAALQRREVTERTALALQERGVVKRMMGDHFGALADLDASLRLDDDDYEVLKQRGFVKFLLKDEDGARADAEKALTNKPSDDVDYEIIRRSVLGAESVRYLDFELL